MKKIKLTQGKYALVDDEDYGFLSRHKWCVHKTRGGILYVETHLENDKKMYMHRMVFGSVRRNCELDHINRNPLDNRKNNLRVATRSENMINRRIFKNKIYGNFKGVTFVRKKWIARVNRNNKAIHIGSFETMLKAKRARDKFLSTPKALLKS